MKCKSGFSLVELLIVVTILGLLVTMIMPSLGRVKALGRRAVCASNLSSATKGMTTYAVEYGGKFPTRGYGSSTSAFDVMGWDVTANPDSVDSNSRNLFLAVRLPFAFIEPGALVCPATDDKPAVRESGGHTHYDFNTDKGNDFKSKCSYSYHLQFRNRHGGPRGYPLSVSSDQSLALLADKNPFVKYPGSDDYRANVGFDGADPKTTNSENHPRLSSDDVGGQNVALLHGGVQWMTSPTVGPDGDNIYTVWDGSDKSGGTLAASSMPKGRTDSIVVP